MADGGEPSSGPKAIASLARKQSDVTRQGTQKLKFVPTLPARRKKDEVKQETAKTSAQPSDKGDGKGRSKGKARAGEARGDAPRPPPVEMTASGPFAMGPALAGTSARRSTPKSSFTPVVPQGLAKLALGANLSNSAAPRLKEKQRESPLTQPPKNESDDEVYSEPDEGVEIIDMENVWQLDCMAPETLQRDRRDRRKRKIKAEAGEHSLASVSKGPPVGQADHSNALDLSDSEEDELETLVEHFAIQTEEGTRQERLYFFQFPEPFPTFVPTSEPGTSMPKRKVSFAADVRTPTPSASTTPAAPSVLEAPQANVDGAIGHLEVYRSGAVKMRLGNGIVLNASEATQPSFLQQAVYLNMKNKELCVLGEIDKRFVVSPDLDALLGSMELADTTDAFDDVHLIKMDTT